MNKCKVEGCESTAQYKTGKYAGYCNKHWRRIQKYGDPLLNHPKYCAKSVCKVKECDELEYAITGEHAGYCEKHYYRVKRHGDPMYVSRGNWEKKQCKVKGCKRLELFMTGEYAGYCNKHRSRLMIHGTVDIENPSNIGLSPFQRFKKKIKVNKETKCWEWVAGLGKDGYGKFRPDSKQTSAHRFSYKYFKGKIPKGMFVCHHCDNPLCCNPEHLFIGTNQDNMNDMVKKDRQFKPIGEKNNSAKLTNKKVLQIRQKVKYYKNKKEAISKLAIKYDVGERTVMHIINRRTWKHI